jgi:cell division protein FtsB
MRDIGIRIQRYKLSRYRPPGAVSERARLFITLGLAAWLIWALFLSDHSVVRLLALNGKKADTEARLKAAQASVAKLETDLRLADDPAVGERVLRDRHNFAKEGERLYVMPHVDGSTAPRVDERIPADATTPAVVAPAPVVHAKPDAGAAGAGKSSKSATKSTAKSRRR